MDTLNVNQFPEAAMMAANLHAIETVDAETNLTLRYPAWIDQQVQNSTLAAVCLVRGWRNADYNHILHVTRPGKQAWLRNWYNDNVGNW